MRRRIVLQSAVIFRTLSPRDWLSRFASEIEGFLNGGPNLKQKHLEEAKEAGLDPDAIANLNSGCSGSDRSRAAIALDP